MVLSYKCSINGNIPSNVLNVAEPSSLRKLNEQKVKKLRIVFQNYIDSDEYLDVGLTDMYDSLQSVNGHLDFSYYTFSDEYEVMFSVSNAGLQARNFKNCIFSHTEVEGGFEFRGCNFQGSIFKDLIIEDGYDFHFSECDLRNVKFDESIIQKLDIHKCIIDSCIIDLSNLYDQKKFERHNMIIIEGKASNVLKDISNAHYDFSYIDFEGLSFKGFNQLNGVYKHCNFNNSNFSDINIIANINFSTCRNVDFQSRCLVVKLNLLIIALEPLRDV